MRSATYFFAVLGEPASSVYTRAMSAPGSRAAVSRRAVIASFVLAAAVVWSEQGHAWRIPASASGEPPCLPIPDSADVDLSADERARIDAGEIVVRILRRAERGGLAQAIGYLDVNPAWLFDVATDSNLADGMADIIRDVRVVEARPVGKLLRGVAAPALFLPRFEYTLAVSYLEDGTGQCWTQVHGDFRRNEGSHAYLWDPVRKQTLAVFTFEIELEGVLSLLPQSLVMRLTARTLPDYMRSLERCARRLSREDTARAARVEPHWRRLSARLESNELRGRVWHSGFDAALNASGGAARGDEIR